ncbi:acylneuraminate cytidylyltransferase family protein [Gammaproteobacteria bacterium]|nr:acylneuraminate cytidylyltransferase family protein [Gammaproteobacteria bacterium]
MRELGRICVQIPARAGSKRVKAKNLRLVNGKPLISYAIKCALDANIFDEIYINTDSPDLAALGRKYGVLVHDRDPVNASDTATGDDFTEEFIRKVQPDTLVMISPVCPLLTPEDVRCAIEQFRNSDCDTLITCEKTHMQAFCNEQAVNIDSSLPLAPTQQNPEVKLLNWAVTIWDAKAFMSRYAINKSGYLGLNRQLLPIKPVHAFKISNEEDFNMVELLIKARGLSLDENEPKYWSQDSET